MNRKFFTFIHGGNVTVAPQTKIIPQEDFSELLTGQELLVKVQKDAEEYRVSVVKEAEKIKEKAQQEGFEEGLKQWANQLVLLENEIEKVHSELAQLVLPVALKAAKKIIGREIEVSETAVIDIISNSLKSVAHHKVIKLYVCREDFPKLDKNKEQLKKIFDNLEALMIIERQDVKQGGCIIETEGGIINAQLENLWQILDDAFQALIKKETKTVDAPIKKA